MKKKTNPHRGSTLESFLKEEGIYDEAVVTVTKRMLARRLAELMKK
jgi:hypothetical protein